MTIRVAINGLGRIGRCVMRAIEEHKDEYKDIQIVAANGPAATKNHIHLLKYDSIHGSFPNVKQLEEDVIDMGSGPIKIFHERDPENLPWKELGIDIVFECTGIFKTHADASKHIKAGAKKVLISAPATDPDSTIVFGVNNDALKSDHTVISVGSCTTNCLAPVAKVLNDTIGIENGVMTTIHAYTNDQNIADGSHKDLRRARAAALSMIPTSTGAAKAIGLVLPELAGKLDGVAVRVPTPNVSLVDLSFNASRDTSVEEINKIVKEASSTPILKGVLDVCDEPLVSIDFNHSSASSIFDISGTKVINNKLCRIASWYDNEWGFSVRMLDVARLAMQ